MIRLFAEPNVNAHRIRRLYYLWNTGDTTTSITVTPTITTTYSVIISNGICADTANVQITVGSPVTAMASNDTTICGGQSILLTASGGTNYLWSNGATTDSITVSPSSSSSFSVTVSSGSCFDTATVNVTVNPAQSFIFQETRLFAEAKR